MPTWFKLLPPEFFLFLKFAALIGFFVTVALIVKLNLTSLDALFKEKNKFYNLFFIVSALFSLVVILNMFLAVF